MRYRSRYNLYEKFAEDALRKGCKLWTIEHATGKRPPVVTDQEKNFRHIHISSSNLSGILWNKESLQNIAVQHMTALQPEWRAVCFMDADIKMEEGWIEEVYHALQLHPVVQPWSHAIDFAPDGGAIGDRMQLSFAYCHVNDIQPKTNSGYLFGGHPGYAIAMRREAFNAVGGMVDIASLGSGDRHQMCAIVGRVQDSFHQDVSPGYKRWLFQWQSHAVKHIKKNLGYVPATLRHMFHGSKKHRSYGDRWKILVKWQYDPYTDLKRDSSGLWQLVVETERQIGLRDALYKYFRSRQEDSNSL